MLLLLLVRIAVEKRDRVSRLTLLYRKRTCTRTTPARALRRTHDTYTEQNLLRRCGSMLSFLLQQTFLKISTMGPGHMGHGTPKTTLENSGQRHRAPLYLPSTFGGITTRAIRCRYDGPNGR